MDAELEKEPAILAVLDRLRLTLGRHAFVLADHWESDVCAVGIASPQNSGVLVYIACYRETPGYYDFELELPPLPDDDFVYRVAGIGSGVSFEELAGVVAGHLKHAESVTAPDLAD